MEPPTRAVSASIRQHVATLGVCLAIAAITVGVSVVQYPGFSIIDEMTHVDYAYRLSDGELVRRGDRLSPNILEELACRGYQTNGPELPDCAAEEFDPRDFPADGYNYNNFHPPLYYALDAMGASAIQAVAPVESYVTAARLVGVGWLGGGMFVSWLLFLELGVGVFTSRLTASAMGLLPVVVNLSSIVNNDAAALVAGAAIALTVVRYVRGRGSLWTLVAACVVAALMKSVFLSAGILAVLLVLDDAWRRRRTRGAWKPAVAVAVAIPLIFGAVQVGWKIVQQERISDETYSNPLAATAGKPSDGVPILDLLEESTAFFPTTRRALPTPQADSAMVEPWLDLSNLLIAGGPLCVWLMVREDLHRRRFAGAVFASLVLGALSVMVVFYIQSDSVKGGLNPRYGLALLPATVACAAMLIDRTQAGRLASLVTVTAAGVIVVGHIAGSW